MPDPVPVPAPAPARVWRVVTSNGAFWQIHHVVAVDEAAARALAESEHGANDPRALAAEARAAAEIGEDPAGRYAAHRVDEVDDADPENFRAVSFVAAGGEG
jgi:hypothetical protein